MFKLTNYLESRRCMYSNVMFKAKEVFSYKVVFGTLLCKDNESQNFYIAYLSIVNTLQSSLGFPHLQIIYLEN